jgi:hypothetical protein
MSTQEQVYDPCVRPVTIRRTTTDLQTGVIKDQEFEKRCGTRRKDKCEPCSKIWKRDAYFALISPSKEHKSSLTFITLTAPGVWFFGQTHTAQWNNKPSERCACRAFHQPHDEIVGTPVEPDDFDYDKVVEFNNKVSRLTTVTLQKIHRLLLTDLNRNSISSTKKTIRDVRLPTARVMEWQERGVLHVHIIVRGFIPTYIIENAVKGSQATKTRRRIEPTTYQHQGWGNQVNVRHLNSADSNQIGKLSSYVTKVVNYALKDVDTETVEQSKIKSNYHRKLRYWTNQVVKCDKPFSECNASMKTPEDVIRYRTIERKQFCVKHRRAHHQIGFTGNVLTMNRAWGSSLRSERLKRQGYAQTQGQSVRPAVKAGRLDYVKKLVTHVVVRKDKNSHNYLLAKSKMLQTVKDGGIHPPDNQ